MERLALLLPLLKLPSCTLWSSLSLPASGNSDTQLFGFQESGDLGRGEHVEAGKGVGAVEHLDFHGEVDWLGMEGGRASTNLVSLPQKGVLYLEVSDQVLCISPSGL